MKMDAKHSVPNILLVKDGERTVHARPGDERANQQDSNASDPVAKRYLLSCPIAPCDCTMRTSTVSYQKVEISTVLPSRMGEPSAYAVGSDTPIDSIIQKIN